MSSRKSLLDPSRYPPVDRFRTRWLALPPLTRGALWMLFSGLMGAIMNMLAKFLGAHLDAFQISFVRALFGLLALLPFAMAAGPRVFVTRRPWGHLFRGMAGAGGMMGSFYAVTKLPLADSTAYGFTAPFFLILLAVTFLGEKIRARRLTATVIGFIGVLIMMRPAGTTEFAAFVAIFGAACNASVSIFVKRLIQTESSVTVLLYFCITSTVILMIPALFVWQTPTWPELGLLCLMGVIGSLSQTGAIRAFNVAEATAISALDYLKLIYAGLFGYFIFSEIPSIWTLVGAGVIISSSGYIAYREYQLDRRSRRASESRSTVKDTAKSMPENPSASLAKLPHSNEAGT